MPNPSPVSTGKKEEETDEKAGQDCNRVGVGEDGGTDHLLSRMNKLDIEAE